MLVQRRCKSLDPAVFLFCVCKEALVRAQAVMLFFFFLLAIFSVIIWVKSLDILLFSLFLKEVACSLSLHLFDQKYRT